jgi:hypothetical protein
MIESGRRSAVPDPRRRVFSQSGAAMSDANESHYEFRVVDARELLNWRG